MYNNTPFTYYTYTHSETLKSMKNDMEGKFVVIGEKFAAMEGKFVGLEGAVLDSR